MASLPPNKPRFKGIRLPPEYEKIINEAVEQDNRQPEDSMMPEIQNRLKKYGGINPAD